MQPETQLGLSKLTYIL